MSVRTTEGWVPNETTQRIMGRVALDDFVQDIEWDEAIARLAPPPMPDYVRSSIHGIPGGYSIPGSAATWDAVVKEIFAEYFLEESVQRDMLCSSVQRTPARILDAACGTGESTRAWRRRFPDAQIVAFDVSPYMAAVAQRKLAGDPNVTVRCLDAEHLPFEDASFDLVTASLLFHEVPEDVSPAILAELRRVVAPDGEIAVMEPYDVNGRTLHPIAFPEPYLRDYLRTDWDAAFQKAGFAGVQTNAYGEGWIRTATAA